MSGSRSAGATGPGAEGGRFDRGQLIIVGGLALAIALVAVALILNSAIYTGNLATRSGESLGGGPAAVQDDVRGSVGDLVEYANARETGTGDQEAVVVGNVSDIDLGIGRHAAVSGRSVSVSYTGAFEDGQRIEQTNASRNFTDSSAPPDADWSLTSSATEIRRFRMVVNRTSLEDSASDAFTVEFDDGADEWDVSIYRDGTEEVVVDTDPPSGYDARSCAVTENATGYLAVDLTAGTVGGRPCPALEFLESGETYQIDYENGDDVNGTYEVTLLDDVANTGALDSLGALPGGLLDADGPFYRDVLYSVDVDVVYRSDVITYDATLRVAPGEPDE